MSREEIKDEVGAKVVPPPTYDTAYAANRTVAAMTVIMDHMASALGKADARLAALGETEKSPTRIAIKRALGDASE